MDKTKELSQAEMDAIRERKSRADHAVDNAPKMHTDDMGQIWTRAYGDLWPRVDIPALLSTVDALRARLEAVEKVWKLADDFRREATRSDSAVDDSIRWKRAFHEVLLAAALRAGGKP